MKASISATFLGTETVQSADKTKTFHRIGILQGLNVKTFSVTPDLYAAIVSKGFKPSESVVAEVEIVDNRDKTFVLLLDINAA